MPFQYRPYRIEQALTKPSTEKLDKEVHLENHIPRYMGILSVRWMPLGRQVWADSGKYIDLPAVDGSEALSIHAEGAGASLTTATYQLDG